MDKMREEFEVWFNGKHKTENESLNFAIREAMFDAWKASRESQCVELPQQGVLHHTTTYNAADVRSALDNAGVKYK